MNAFAAYLLTYVVGGLTFFPLVILVIGCHALITLPQHAGPSNHILPDILEPGDKDDELEERLVRRNDEPDVAAGYFAVCREYVPGGVNGKPPERTTPAGQTIVSESPSVYQTMYRSIFDRGKGQVPSIEAGRNVKKARNVFYVVLR